MGSMLGKVLMMSIGFIFVAVGFIMYPNVTTACTTLLDWSYAANVTITDATFTGLTTTIGIFPLMSLLGFVALTIIGGFLGVKLWKGAANTLNIGMFLVAGISLIFISLGLNIFPVLLDALASIVHGGGSGISTAFTGLLAIVLMVPMLSILSFLVGTVVSGYFGISLNSEMD